MSDQIESRQNSSDGSQSPRRNQKNRRNSNNGNQNNERQNLERYDHQNSERSPHDQQKNVNQRQRNNNEGASHKNNLLTTSSWAAEMEEHEQHQVQDQRSNNHQNHNQNQNQRNNGNRNNNKNRNQNRGQESKPKDNVKLVQQQQDAIPSKETSPKQDQPTLPDKVNEFKESSNLPVFLQQPTSSVEVSVTFGDETGLQSVETKPENGTVEAEEKQETEASYDENHQQPSGQDEEHQISGECIPHNSLVQMLAHPSPQQIVNGQEFYPSNPEAMFYPELADPQSPDPKFVELNPGEQDYIIPLNIGGRHFETTFSRLMQYPHSRFATIWTQQIQTTAKNEFFFDRDPNVAEVVLNFIRTGRIFVNPNISIDAVKEEARYFGMENEMFPTQASNTFKFKTDFTKQITNTHAFITTVFPNQILCITSIHGHGLLLVDVTDKDGNLIVEGATLFDSQLIALTQDHRSQSPDSYSPNSQTPPTSQSPPPAHHSHPFLPDQKRQLYIKEFLGERLVKFYAAAPRNASNVDVTLEIGFRLISEYTDLDFIL